MHYRAKGISVMSNDTFVACVNGLIYIVSTCDLYTDLLFVQLCLLK